MSDSEEESQDRQLKIVILGDGACGKVSAPHTARGHITVHTHCQGPQHLLLLGATSLYTLPGAPTPTTARGHITVQTARGPNTAYC